MKERLTIVGVFPAPEIRTGGHRRFLELMRGMEARGHSVLLLSRSEVQGATAPLPGKPLYIFEERTSTIYRRVIPAWMRYLLSARKRADLLPQGFGEEPAAVVVFSPTDYFAGRLIAKRIKAPLLFSLRSNIVAVHDRFGMLYKESKRFKGLQRLLQRHWKQFLERHIITNSDRVVFQSEYDRDDVLGRNPGARRRSVVIPNSMQASWFPPELRGVNQSHECRRLIFLGSVGERKGIQYLLPAMRELCRERGLPISLDIVGFGNLEDWARAYITKEKIQDCVRLTGRETNPLARLAQADLLVVPSLYDSFPNTVLEALFAGTPVVGSDTSGIRSILAYDELLFQPKSVEAIVSKIEPLVLDQERFGSVKALCETRGERFDFDWYGEFEAVLLSMAAATDRVSR
jgi:glycosyltransferase involved in cell wall biosynthesis